MRKNCRSFPFSAGKDAVILILGSMPGIESLRQQQYYAHPRNAFWKIMGQLFGFSPALPYKEKLQRLQENKIALWDTVHSCVREGSLDSDIKHAEVNDLENFFKQHKALKAIFFNGQTAYKLFRQHMENAIIPELELRIMPSTSPAHASKTYEQKLKTWEKIIEYTKKPA